MLQIRQAGANTEGTAESELYEHWPGSEPEMGPLKARARPSSIKRDCDRRATSTGQKLTGLARKFVRGRVQAVGSFG